jgi:hypothetical protein
MYAKGNQPDLQSVLQGIFTPGRWAKLPTQSAEEVDKGHGRVERRCIQTSDAIQGWDDWTDVGQGFCMDREVLLLKSGKRRHERVYGISSLTPEEAGPEELLALTRAHWGIENRSHYVRDVTFNEDHSQVRVGAIPQVMAALRNAAIGLMRLAGTPSIAAACRRHAARPHDAVALVVAPLRTE